MEFPRYLFFSSSRKILEVTGIWREVSVRLIALDSITKHPEQENGQCAADRFRFLFCGERPVDGVKAPFLARLDQHRSDDEWPLGSLTTHPVAQTVNPKMGGIRQAIIERFRLVHQ